MNGFCDLEGGRREGFGNECKSLTDGYACRLDVYQTSTSGALKSIGIGRSTVITGLLGIVVAYVVL